MPDPLKGDCDDFVAFARACQDGLWRFAFMLSHCRAEADDLVQEAFARIFPRWRSLMANPDAKPQAYARTVIVRLFVSQARKQRRELLVAEPADVATEHPVVDVDRNGFDLANAVRALPPKQRATIVLTYWADYTDEQIAQALKCSQVTVRTNRRHALTKLRAGQHRITDDASLVTEGWR